MGSNSWKSLKNVPQVICSDSSATVQGSIHWRTRDKDGILSFLILSFHLASENFYFLELPRSYFEPGMDEGKVRIMNFGGCLSIVDFCYVDRIELWVLKEYNVKESWTKLVVMRRDVITGVNYMSIYPVSPWKDVEILLLNDSRKFVSYSFETGRYTLFQVDGLPGNYNLNDFKLYHHYDVRPYDGNLLSVQLADYNNNQDRFSETRDSRTYLD